VTTDFKFYNPEQPIPPEVESVYDEVATQLFALRLMITRGAGHKALGRVLADFETYRPTEVLAFPDDLWAARYGMKGDALKSFKESAGAAEQLHSELTAKGIAVLVAGSLSYPRQLTSSLRSQTPPVLFALGDLNLIRVPGVGFCGSRNASVRALGAVTACASDLAHRSINVISGYAKGVDITAHKSSLAAGGFTTIVLAEGINHFRLKVDLDVTNANDLLVISQFPPSLPWNVGNAMLRNRTICSLSDAMVVVESQLDGGTFAAGQAALAIGRPLYVIDFGEEGPNAPGNRYFLDHGARPLRRTRMGQPSTSGLINDAIRQATLDEKRKEAYAQVLAEDEELQHSLRPSEALKLF
jgi:predicted Rossmann fold nucleotide-binding protein DprA/Smf involved in DNA uptake